MSKLKKLVGVALAVVLSVSCAQTALAGSVGGNQDTERSQESQVARIAKKSSVKKKTVHGIKYELHDTGKGVVAILKNNNKYAVELTAKLVYYRKGKMIDSKSDVNYAFEKGKTCALFFDAPLDSDFEYVDYDNYKISISVEKGTYLICGSSKIKTTSNFGEDNVTVKVKNNYKKKLSYIQIACVFYDSDGNAIGYEHHYADCKKKGSVDYLTFYFPYDEDYDTIYPDSYKIYVNNAYTYTWM